MRSSTETALQRYADSWDTMLAERDGGELNLARELFAVADVVKDSPILGRALTDPARAAVDRSRLMLDVVGSKVSGPVADLLSGLVRSRWADGDELGYIIDRLGIQSVMAGAGRVGHIDEIESELYRVRRMLRDERDLRVALGDRSRTRDERAALAAEVFTGVRPGTALLIDHAVRMAPKLPITQSLSVMTDAAADRTHRLVASVTTAVPMTQSQEERLQRLLTERYRGPVNVHVYADPRVIGGVRLRVGEDVIDGTLRHRLDQLHEAMK